MTLRNDHKFFILNMVSPDRSNEILDCANTTERLSEVIQKKVEEGVPEGTWFYIRSVMLSYLALVKTVDMSSVGRVVSYFDCKGDPVELFDVWFVCTEKAYWGSEKDKLKAEKYTYSDAEEYIYFEHADEPSPDRSEFWNYVTIPTGCRPYLYQRQ